MTTLFLLQTAAERLDAARQGLDTPLAERLIGEGRSIPKVAKLLKVHRATLYRALAATA